MRRLTRRIGLFGGPGALMPAMGVKKPGPVSSARSAPEPASPAGTSKGSEALAGDVKKKSWLRRLWGSKRDPGE
ncbi:MAG TPA: hypothetical protein VGL03_07055 [Thermoanaerobaculia bacterium]|jgi:hypothetical protein